MVEQWVEVAVSITLWYLTSFGTLMLNKYLLGTVQIQPNTLAVVQMVSTALYGALKIVSFPALVRAAFKAWARRTETDDLEDPHKGNASGHWRRGLMQISFVGVMRFSTVVLGLVSLKHVAASFTETIKASAPFFTVIIAYMMLGESTTPMVMLSLVPVAGGLVLVSSTELSFNVIGFAAAVATNVIECVQNVFSKRLLAREYTASQLQFYTSVTALVLQAPLFVFSQMDAAQAHAGVLHLPGNSTLGLAPLPGFTPAEELAGGGVLSTRTLALLWVDGVLYHLQSVVAYVVMSHLSPVTVSVVNTLKRAILIWISVLIFGNPVSLPAKVGTGICLLGALSYNIARQSLSGSTFSTRSRSVAPQKV